MAALVSMVIEIGVEEFALPAAIDTAAAATTIATGAGMTHDVVSYIKDTKSYDKGRANTILQRQIRIQDKKYANKVEEK